MFTPWLNARSMFGTDGEGGDLFFPWGKAGRAVRVDSAGLRERLMRAAVGWGWANLLFVFLAFLWLGYRSPDSTAELAMTWLPAFIVAPLMMLLHWLHFRSIVKGHQRVSIAYRRPRRWDRWALLDMFVMLILLFTAGFIGGWLRLKL